MRRGFSLLLVTCVLWPAATVAADAEAELREALALGLCDEDLLDVDVGAAVIDLADGRLLFGHNQDQLYNPASVSKLVTVAAALEILRPEYRFPTILRAQQPIGPDGVLPGHLFVEGRGDPSLVSERLWKLVRNLRHIGLKKIAGRVVVDESYFDRERENVGWDCDDSSAAYRARAGAFSLNFNSVRLTLRPAPRAGQAALVEVGPPTRYVQVRSKLVTDKRRSWFKASSVGNGSRTIVDLKGHLNTRSWPRTVYVRIMDPARYAGTVLAEFLNREGIKVSPRPLIRPAPEAASETIWTERSEALGVLVRQLSKNSNNFQSEQLLKVLGAQTAGPPGTWADGREAVAGVLARVGIRPGTYRFRNGSGLGEANLFTPRQIVKLIRWAAGQPSTGAEFLASLPVAAADGTIRARLGDTAADRVLRAKTGSLESVSALAGVVQGRRGARAFAIFMNGNLRGRIRQMWRFQDAFGARVAEDL